MANAGITLASLKKSKWKGQCFVWMFQALHTVINSGLPLMENPRQARKHFYRKLADRLRKNPELLLEAVPAPATPSASATPSVSVSPSASASPSPRRGRPPGRKNNKTPQFEAEQARRQETERIERKSCGG